MKNLILLFGLICIVSVGFNVEDNKGKNRTISSIDNKVSCIFREEEGRINKYCLVK